MMDSLPGPHTICPTRPDKNDGDTSIGRSVVLVVVKVVGVTVVVVVVGATASLLRADISVPGVST